jgi:uncharacterized protein (TIGR00369 family)
MKKNIEHLLGRPGLKTAGLAKILDMELLSLSRGRVRGRMPWSKQASQWYGLIHGGALAAFADTAAGVGSAYVAPAGTNVLTSELKINFFANITSGSIDCDAKLVHKGRRSLVWEIRITETGKRNLLALSIITYVIVDSKGGK